ncbi:bromodomain-containing protein 4 isoform X2 [Prorops nasuta]
MFLRRVFRKKCQESKCENPFNTDVDFELLPLRQKVEILRALCDFRLDAEDVEQALCNLDSDSLRVEPLGHDRKNSAYWYFYGTRLYREDYIESTSIDSCKQGSKAKDKKRKKRRNRVAREEEKAEEEKISLVHREEQKTESVWQVVCFTQQDWTRLAEKFRNSEYDTERKLYRTLSEDFMPEIPKLFDLKEKQQRRKLLQRNNSRVLRSHEPAVQMDLGKARSKIKPKTNKTSKKTNKNSKAVFEKEDISPPTMVVPPQKKGRQTNNSLASAVGQIVIHTRDEVEDLQKKKNTSHHGISNYVSSYGYSFGIEEEERRVGMHKVLESLKDHADAWPFIDPVDEEYAPRYYSVVRKPMDLSTMEEKLEGGSYKSINQFKRDFRLIVDNCRQYNGSDNEYTEMAINLKEAFEKAVNRYLESETSSDEGSHSPGSVTDSPPPSHVALSSQQSSKKRIKKSNKKSKSTKAIHKRKLKFAIKEEEKSSNNSVKSVKDKKGKKKCKKAKSEKVTEEEEEEEEEDKEETESEEDLLQASVTESKRRKSATMSDLPEKTKKFTAKEIADKKKSSKKAAAKDGKYVKNVQSTAYEDVKENKEYFEEGYEDISPTKSRSRKIDKHDLENNRKEEKSKKNKQKEILAIDADLKEEEGQEKLKKENEESKPFNNKGKKSQKKEKSVLKNVSKSDEKSNRKNLTKEKDKKSKRSKEERSNGEVKSEKLSKDVRLNSAVDSKKRENPKKLPASIANKDLESLDSLKDKISERRREEELKQEREKLKKIGKHENHGVYSKKVPSNGSTFHDVDKSSPKRSKSKKTTKDKKSSTVEEKKTSQDQDSTEPKKGIKGSTSKYTKGFGKEESSAIQALNQATEQTLNDINKWLDDAPRLSEFSSGSDSPVFHPAADSRRPGGKAEISRKRPSAIKIFGPNGPTRPKKIQRTIDRLQPGKSKGNLLLKKPISSSNANTSDATVNPLTTDIDPCSKDTDDEPKLSLGTVLKNVDSIQSICKSMAPSPNTNLSNEDEDDDPAGPASPKTATKEEKSLTGKIASRESTKETSKDSELKPDDSQKPKSATPNLSAWFKAFGAPKSKKKEEEADENTTKKFPEGQDGHCSRQRRMSAEGSSVSESVSSFSQESPPGHQTRSPQSQPVVPPVETQMRGAGFYQDALSTGSSPYNSPYYATPPRYSAQLPPTPSPQNRILSPAYPSTTTTFDQAALYSQPSQSPQTYQKSPQDGSTEPYRQISPTFSHHSPQSNFSQNSPQCETYTQLGSSNPSPTVYSQHSPQPPSQAFPQASPQPLQSFSQQSPQQPPTPKYSQSSPQSVATNYSEPSSPNVPPSYSQQQAPTPKEHPSYSQPNSPINTPNYSQPSPQQRSPYPQPSPQPSGYSRVSPQQLSSNYSQLSPQATGPPSVYSQSSQPSYSQAGPESPHQPGYSQPSPQACKYPQSSTQEGHNFSQPSPQGTSAFSQPSPQNSSFAKTSPQPPANYSQKTSPQQPPPSYSHPQTSTSDYPQLSPQQRASRAYQQQPSPQQKPVCSPQTLQSPASYSQPSPQQTTNYVHPHGTKNVDEYTASSALQNVQSPYLPHSSSASVSTSGDDRRDLAKPTESKPGVDQARSFIQPEATLGLSSEHQVYQPPTQYPPTYPSSFSSIDLQRSAPRHSIPEQQQQQQQQQQQSHHERSSFPDISDSLSAQKYTQQRFHVKAANPNEQLQQQEQQSQLLAFQQNLSAHESLYQSSFPASGYPMANSRPVYPSPHYFDASGKPAPGGTSNPSLGGAHPPVKKRAYNDSGEAARNLSQDPRSGQEQYGYDPMLALAQQEAVPVSQFDSAYAASLSDSIVANPAYARLGLGLVGRSTKDQQQLLTIPRPPPTKAEHLAYARSATTSNQELELLQNLQNATSKNTQGMLSIPRRVTEVTRAASPATTKPKRGRKSKQQHQHEQQIAAAAAAAAAASAEQQNAGIPGFPQYTTAVTDPISLKNAPVVSAGSSAFNFAPPVSSTAASSPFYDKDASAAAAAFAFLDEFRNPSYYSMALRQQQQQQQQQQQSQPATVSDSTQSACTKLGSQPNPPRNYAAHPFLHSAQRTAAAYGPPVSAYVTPHGPNLAMDPAAYQQYLHSLYALQPPPHHHRPTWPHL